MSILLDALKRSESQRELGRTPTLQTGSDAMVPVAAQTPAWLPGLMALVTAGLISWMGLQQFDLPDDWEETRLAGQDQPSAAGSHEAAGEPGDTGDRSEPAAGKSILPRLPQSSVASQMASSEVDAPQRQLSREVRDYAAEKSPASTRAKQAETRQDNAVRQTELARVEVAPGVQPRQGRASPAAADPLPDAADPYEPEIISWWQVPEKMREGLPDLRISVLVYAEQPDNRFLLLNGERLKEGQELPNGLLLEEIRRDRAIFNYRNYRFFLKS